MDSSARWWSSPRGAIVITLHIAAFLAAWLWAYASFSEALHQVRLFMLLLVVGGPDE